MKNIFLIVLPLLLIVGCSKEPINYEEILVERDGIFYTKDTNKPYSGRVFSLYDDGKKKDEGTFKDGKLIWRTEWKYHGNGQKWFEGTFKDGFRDGLFTNWYENGQKKEEYFYDNGKPDGLSTKWYENGKKRQEGPFKDGRIDGLWIEWNENGQKKEKNYRDGERWSGVFEMVLVFKLMLYLNLP